MRGFSLPMFFVFPPSFFYLLVCVLAFCLGIGNAVLVQSSCHIDAFACQTSLGLTELGIKLKTRSLARLSLAISHNPSFSEPFLRLFDGYIS